MESVFVYLLVTPDGNSTYIGVTVDLERRLRQHNGQIAGGAKATRKSQAWKRVCYIQGFPDRKTALQFEWKWKKMSRYRYKVCGKIKTLCELLTLERVTKNAISSDKYHLTIFVELPLENLTVPDNVSVQIIT